jgi:hypothetical protein
MAKRRSAPNLTTTPVAEQFIPTDDLFASIQSDVSAKNVKKNVPIPSKPLIHVLPVPALSVRMLFKNEGMPLGFFYVIVGVPASYKSTFGLEVGRWHALCNGLVAVAETEGKGNPDLPPAIYDWHPNQLQSTVCQSLEDWQTVASHYIGTVQKLMSKSDGPGASFPFMMMVDSLSGRLSRKVAETIMKEGHAKKRFADEAKFNTDWIKAYGGVMVGWPFTFMAVNHLKTGSDPVTGLPVFNIPGGEQLKFANVMTISMGLSRGIEQFKDYKAALVSLRMEKNSYGPGGGQIQVRYRTWYEDDGNGQPKLKSRFEWHEASILMLFNGFGLRKKEADFIVPRTHEICDVHEKSGGSGGKLFWSNRLGVPSSDAMKARDLGLLLETKPDVLGDLYRVLEINRRPFFQPGIDYRTQIDNYTNASEQQPLPPRPPIDLRDDDETFEETAG